MAQSAEDTKELGQRLLQRARARNEANANQPARSAFNDPTKTAANAAQRAADAAQCGTVAKGFLVPLQKLTLGFANAAMGSFGVLVVFLLLFIVHQLFFWIDEKPESAFDQAALAFNVVEITWDTLGLVFNGGVDIVNSGVVPLWNSAVYYTLEPTIALVLEIFSVVFLRQSWNGIVGDEFYYGFDCTANPEAVAWCGRYAFYADKLESPEVAPFFVEESQAYGSRRLDDVLWSNETFVFGLSTARRLADLSDGTVATPAFSTKMLTNALDWFVNLVLTILPPILDMGFAILQEIVITSFTVLVDIIETVVVQLIEIVKMLFKSGMLTTLMNVGMDFLVIGFTELALPMLFAAIDTLMCVLDFFAFSGWGEQLECVEMTCFKGPSITSDLIIFTSVPVVLGRFTAIMDATLNSRSGQKFVQGFSGEFTTQGRTKTPAGKTINNNEPEGASAGSPITGGGGFAEDFDAFIGTTAADECAKCFTCKATTTLRFEPSQPLAFLFVFIDLTVCRRFPSCDSFGF